MKILLIVDVQNGFVRSDETKVVAQKIVQLSKEHKFNYIIASKFINNPDSPYVNVLKWNVKSNKLVSINLSISISQ